MSAMPGLQRRRPAGVDAAPVSSRPRWSVPTVPALPTGADLGTWLVALLAFNEFSGLSKVVTGLVGVSPFVPLLALASGGLVLVWLRDRPRPPVPVLVAMGLYVLAVAASYLGSPLDVEVVQDGLTEALKEAYFVVLVCLLGVRSDRWSRVALAIALPMAVIGWMAAANEWVFHDHLSFLGFENVTTVEGEDVATARHAGPLEDPNFWGRLVVVGVPFLLAWLVERGRRHLGRTVIVGVPALVGLLLAVYLTGSRGTFLATGVGLVVFGLLCGIRRRHLVAALLVSPVLLVVPGVGNRLQVALGILGSGQRAGVDSSVLERLSAQRIALQMIESHPVLGVGPGGYMAAFPQESALAGLTMRRIVAPHNGYLGTAAEIGLLGATFWALVIVVGLVAALRARAGLVVLPTPVQRRLRPYVAATVAALAAWLFASIFLHVTYPRVVWLLVAFGGLQERHVRGALEALPREALARGGRIVRPVVVVTAAAAALLGGLAGGVAAHASTPTYEGRLIGHLVPVKPRDSYLIAIRTREFVVPTYAVLVDSSAPRGVHAQGDPLTGAVTLTSDAVPDAAAASRSLREGAASGIGAIEHTGLGRLYTIEWETPRVAPQDRPVPTYALAGAALAALAALAVARLRRPWALDPSTPPTPASADGGRRTTDHARPLPAVEHVGPDLTR